MSLQTWQTPTTAGDERNLFGQGKPMAKDSSGSGADWGTGIESYTTEATVLQIESRLDFDGTVAPTDLDRATDAREKGRIGIFGSALSYAGNSGRVTSEPIGRDLNPLGRGDGGAYIAGGIRSGFITPELPYNESTPGTGFSVNNAGQLGHCAPCCETPWGDTLQAMGPPPADECGLCSQEEWRSQCNACHYRHCACIARGCLHGSEMISNQFQAFRECGCERFGIIDPPAGGHPGNCTPGKLKSTGGGGGGSTPPGGGGGGGCPGCGGGGGGGGHTMMTPTKGSWQTHLQDCYKHCDSIWVMPWDRPECKLDCWLRYAEGLFPMPGKPGLSINCDNIPTSFTDCVIGNPPSTPNTETLKACFAAIIAACGCEEICDQLWQSNPTENNACKCACCYNRDESEPMLIVAGGGSSAGGGFMISVAVSTATCLCKEILKAIQVPVFVDCDRIGVDHME